MRFHYAEAMRPIMNYLPRAQAAEANGYAGFTISDSLIDPKASGIQYSYTEDGDRGFLENTPFLESFVLSAVTIDSLARHADLGVTDMVVVSRNLDAVEEDDQPFGQKIDDLKRFVDDVISRAGGR